MKHAALFICLLSALGINAQACSVCMGASDSLTASAANGAIFLMLGFIGAILVAIGSFVFYLAKRSSAGYKPGFTPLHGETKHA